MICDIWHFRSNTCFSGFSLWLSFYPHRIIVSRCPESFADCQGSFSKKLQIGASHGRGIFAAEKISPQLLISVPSRCILFDETIEHESEEVSDVARYLRGNETAKKLSNKLLLTAFIMQQLVLTKPSTRFAPYLLDLRKSFPATVPEIPLFWTKEDKAELKGTSALTELPKMFRAIGQEYEVLKSASPALAAKHGLAEFQAAYAFVATRTFTLQTDPPVAALYPMIDLVNHGVNMPEVGKHQDISAMETGSAMVEIQQNTGDFNALLKSQQTIAKGEEVSITYGLFSNTHLLLKYGFVSPWLHNSTCLTKIKLEFQAVDHFRIFRDPNDPNPLGKAIGKNIVFTLDACPGEGTWLKALSFARIWRSRHAERCMDPSDVWTEWHLDIECEWLLPEEEMAALEDLSAALAQAWSRYPGGSLEEEEKLLQKRLTSKRRTAIVVRRDEKYTLWKLQRFIDDAKSRLERLRRDTSNDRSWRQYMFAMSVPRDEL